ncbi:MAG: hypothetical protein A3E83_05925 [Gammaproteobacteria bacterium RIFCSPHIGHO2_12_FULL_41_20]|nr:MAG: hypothetical protein A3E83_05925 [Gammaproteobacteria bacterium RIFCSPHIGHO2_12_FULL_41_20]
MALDRKKIEADLQEISLYIINKLPKIEQGTPLPIIAQIWELYSKQKKFREDMQNLYDKLKEFEPYLLEHEKIKFQKLLSFYQTLATLEPFPTPENLDISEKEMIAKSYTREDIQQRVQALTQIITQNVQPNSQLQQLLTACQQAIQTRNILDTLLKMAEKRLRTSNKPEAQQQTVLSTLQSLPRETIKPVQHLPRFQLALENSIIKEMQHSIELLAQLPINLQEKIDKINALIQQLTDDTTLLLDEKEALLKRARECHAKLSEFLSHPQYSQHTSELLNQQQSTLKPVVSHMIAAVKEINDSLPNDHSFKSLNGPDLLSDLLIVLEKEKEKLVADLKRSGSSEWREHTRKKLDAVTQLITQIYDDIEQGVSFDALLQHIRAIKEDAQYTDFLRKKRGFIGKSTGPLTRRVTGKVTSGSHVWEALTQLLEEHTTPLAKIKEQLSENENYKEKLTTLLAAIEKERTKLLASEPSDQVKGRLAAIRKMVQIMHRGIEAGESIDSIACKVIRIKNHPAYRQHLETRRPRKEGKPPRPWNAGPPKLWVALDTFATSYPTPDIPYVGASLSNVATLFQGIETRLTGLESRLGALSQLQASGRLRPHHRLGATMTPPLRRTPSSSSP